MRKEKRAGKFYRRRKSKIMAIPNPDHHLHFLLLCFCMRKEKRAGKFYRRRKSKILAIPNPDHHPLLELLLL